MAFARHRIPELMDDDALDEHAHRRALLGLARINAISGIDRHLWRRAAGLARALGRNVRVLDVAAGSGDVLIRVAERAREAGIGLEAHACDISPVALDEARRKAALRGVTLTTHLTDVIHTRLPGGFDIAYCGLFLHHLDEPQVEIVLRQMVDAANSVLVQDLRRNYLGLGLATVVPRLLTRSRIVHIDAVRSVHAAFTVEEIRTLAHRAGLNGARVQCCWPQRLVVSWERAS